MQNQTTPNLDGVIKDVEKLKDAAEKAAENTQDVKDKKCTAEDEKQEPAYILYQQIANSTINILQNPEIVKGFKEISDKVDPELSKNLVTLIAVAMTQSAHQAVLFYDAFLKRELDKQFDHIANSINKDRADINAITSAMQVFRERIGNLEKAAKSKEFQNQNNI